MFQKHWKSGVKESGDVSVLLVFVLSLILLMASLTLATVVFGTARGARSVVESAQALYNADTAIELGRANFSWNVDGDSDGNVCTVLDDSVTGIPGVTSTFDVVVSGDPAPANYADPPTGQEDANCPTLAEIQAGTRSLCVTTFGESAGKRFRRRVDFDTNVQACRP